MHTWNVRDSANVYIYLSGRKIVFVSTGCEVSGEREGAPDNNMKGHRMYFRGYPEVFSKNSFTIRGPYMAIPGILAGSFVNPCDLLSMKDSSITAILLFLDVNNQHTTKIVPGFS